MENFDVAVIGAGPGGYLAAERCAQKGLKAVVFEKGELGGVCLNEGCIPSKSLLYSAKLLDNAKHSADYGININGDIKVDQEFIIKRKAKVVRTLVAGIRSKLKNLGVTVVKGQAMLASPDTVVCGDTTYHTENIIIATGSAPALPPIAGLKEGLESGFVMTNREALSLTVLPERLVVVGGGVIGLEMAAYYATVGVKVTVIEMLAKIAGNTDGEISASLMKILEKKGVSFELNAAVKEITPEGVSYEKEGQLLFAPADKTLVSVGRRPVLPEGAVEIGLQLERGAIVTDNAMRTNIKGIYAVGDVNGKVMLAHTAYREAEVAVNNITGTEDCIDYSSIPSVIYTTPEIASVGETEESAAAKSLSFKTLKLPITYSGRFVAENNSKDGVCKLIVDAENGLVLGAQIMGSYAGEFIVQAASLITLKTKIDDAKKIVFPHPTVSEIIREALFEI